MRVDLGFWTDIMNFKSRKLASCWTTNTNRERATSRTACCGGIYLLEKLYRRSRYDKTLKLLLKLPLHNSLGETTLPAIKSTTHYLG